MHISLQFGVITACLVLLCFVLRLVLKDSLQLKYSLLRVFIFDMHCSFYGMSVK